MRMRKILVIITSPRVNIQINLYERWLVSFFRPEFMRMCKILMLITSVRAKIQLNLYERILDSYWSAIICDQ